MAITPEQLPSGASEIARAYPDVWAAYAALGKACAEAGPLDRRTARFVKLALAVGALSEGAVHSHTRRALADGLSPEELRHVAVLAIPTLGLPQAAKELGLTPLCDSGAHRYITARRRAAQTEELEGTLTRRRMARSLLDLL